MGQLDQGTQERRTHLPPLPADRQGPVEVQSCFFHLAFDPGTEEEAEDGEEEEGDDELVSW